MKKTIVLALVLVISALALGCETVESLTTDGNTAAAWQKFDAANQKYDAALAKDPNHVDAIYGKAKAFEGAKKFAEAIRAKHPNKLLAYNCSPSFNWKRKLDDTTIAKFQRELGAMGYKFQFVTLAGFHALNHSMFELARGYKARGMSAYSELQQAEFASEEHGYTATRHQREVGTGYFDQVAQVVSGGEASTLALAKSTEAEQFH